MIAPTLGTSEWFAEELLQAKLFDPPYIEKLKYQFRQEEPFGDAQMMGEFLIKKGLLTPFQSKRILAQEAKKLVVGSYLLMEVIGHGSMGPVYRAMGRADRNNYAIKILPLRNQWNVRLARKQVEAIAKLPPNDGIVPFMDVGTSNDQHYLVWSYVEGKSLENIVKESGFLPAGEIAQIGRQLVELLILYQSRNLAHGLIKPTNVLIGFDGRAKLLDFGVGAILSENSDEMDSMVDTVSTAMTTAGMLECSSPEQILDPTLLTVLGDQYSLGCVLYFLATGRYPFPEGSAIDKIFSHQKKKPQPIQKLNPNLPKNLIEIIDRMMSKSLQDRYHRLNDLMEDLRPLASPIHSCYLTQEIPINVQTPLPSKMLLAKDLFFSQSFNSGSAPQNNPSGNPPLNNPSPNSTEPALVTKPPRKSFWKRLFFWS